MTRIRSRQLGVILLLLGPALGKAGIENVSERLFETTSGQLGSQNALRATFATPEGGVVRFGSTRNGGRDAQGEFCAEAFCYFVQLIRRDGTAVFRYLPFPVVLSQGALDSAGFAWIEVFLPVGARATFDLAPGFQPEASRYFAKIDISTGEVALTTRLPSGWLVQAEAKEAAPQTMAVDREGGLWLGGFAATEIPVTIDAIQPWINRGVDALRTGRNPAALMRIAPEGNRITYATYLGDAREGVGAVVIDASGNIYVVGSRIWKITPDGRLRWSTWIPPGAALAAAIGPTGDLFVGGCTTTRDDAFYTTAGAFQERITYAVPVRLPQTGKYPSACYDGFVTRLSANGQIIYSTLVGGTAGNLIHYLSVNSRNEAFFAGFVDVPSKDITWAGLGTRIGRLTADGSAALFLNHYPPWINSTGVRYWADGDEVVLGGSGLYRTPDGVEHYFISSDRLRESPASTPRIDEVNVTGSLSDGYRVAIRGEGFCEMPTAILDGVEYPAPAGADGPAFWLNPLPAPRPNTLVRGDGVSADYDLQMRCGDSLSSLVRVPLQFRALPQ